MVLGLPYAQDPVFTDTLAFTVLLDSSVLNQSLKMRALNRIIAVTAGHINDRNSGSIRCDTFPETTQATLDMIAQAIPVGWWDLSTRLSEEAVHRYESLIV